MSILFIIGIAQALFFCLFLWTKKGNKLPNVLLSVWLVLISFSLLLNYLYSTGKINQFPHLIGLDTAFSFVYMPILYFYAKLVVSKNKRFKAIDTAHLMPFLFYFIYVSVNFYSESAAYKLEFLQKLSNSEFPLDIQISNIIKIILAIVYIVLTMNIIKHHQKEIKLNFSYTTAINLSWLKIITICLSIIYTLKFLSILSVYFNTTSYFGKIEGMSDLAIVAFIYIIAFYGIKQPDIFTKWNNDSEEDRMVADATHQKETFEVITNSKYQGSNLSKEDSEKLLIALQQYMKDEKPFLQNQLSIKDVADSLQVHTKYLSQVINEQLGLNFFNYINDYRVNEVKKRIIAPEYEHLSIVGIALDCGFNSKSSFNSVFKKLTGTTPSKYKSATS